MIATALILKPCLEGRKCQYDNTKQYRYQFIDNEYYWKEKVFDRETGVVYGFDKNEDGMVYRQDFTKGRLDAKKRKEGYWMSPDDKYDIYGNEDYLLYVANKTTAGNNKAEDTSVNKINTTTASLDAEFEKIYGGNGATEAKTDYSSMSDEELLKPTTSATDLSSMSDEELDRRISEAQSRKSPVKGFTWDDVESTTPAPSQGPTGPKKAKSSTTFDASTSRFDNEEFGEIEPINTNGMHNKKVEDLPCIEEENAKLLKQKDRQ